MNNKDSIDLLKHNIGRFDHYYASVNFKSSFLVIGNITLMIFIFSEKLISKNSVFFHISILSGFISLLFVLFAIKPYLKSEKNKNSLIYYGDIASKELSSYKEQVINLKELKYKQDLINQVYFLAKGLKSKFRLLNWATLFFILEILSIVIFTIIQFFCKGV